MAQDNAPEVHIVDLHDNYDREQMARNTCHLSATDPIELLQMAEEQSIGTLASDAGSFFAGIGATPLVSTWFETLVQPQTLAIIIDTRYFTNTGQARLHIQSMDLTTSQGLVHETNSQLPLTLSQDEDGSTTYGEGLVICLQPDHDYNWFHIQLSYTGIDGSRPKAGIVNANSGAFTEVIVD